LTPCRIEIEIEIEIPKLTAVKVVLHDLSPVIFKWFKWAVTWQNWVHGPQNWDHFMLQCY